MAPVASRALGLTLALAIGSGCGGQTNGMPAPDPYQIGEPADEPDGGPQATGQSQDAGAAPDASARSTTMRDTGSDAAAVVRDAARAMDSRPPAATPAPSAIPTTPSQPLLKWGLWPKASDALRVAGYTAGQIVQTVGYAAASAGTHEPDGTVDGQPYSAATDLSVRGLDDAEVRTVVAKLDSLGFAAFYRSPGHDGWPSTGARHIHVVYAGCKMKAILRDQMRDFFAGKNGLASHSTYSFYQPPASVISAVKVLFAQYN
jgi:hypothetical protein